MLLSRTPRTSQSTLFSPRAPFSPSTPASPRTTLSAHIPPRLPSPPLPSQQGRQLHTLDKTQTKLFRHPIHGPLPEEVYHGSFRAKPEAVFEQGLLSIHVTPLIPDHPDEFDEALRQYLMSREALQSYVNRNDLEYRGRQFVGTSKAVHVALQRAVSSRDPEGFLYFIDLRKMARDGYHITDVNKKAGVPTKWEHEIAFLHEVPQQYIIGAREVRLQCVNLQGPNTVEVDSTFIPNPNYVKDEDE